MSIEVSIRAFTATDAAYVRALFIAVNRALAPPEQQAAFEAYITRSLAEEIDRIADYYTERHGGFWVACKDDSLVGMFGLEQVSAEAMELRRMYVDPVARRGGIARRMLQYAEAECRRRGMHRMELSTSEIQQAALALYCSAGYRLVREELAEHGSHKTVGGGIRRYYFEKALIGSVGVP